MIRGILRCSLFIGMVGFVAAAIGAHALWRKTDKMVEAALLRQIQERVPDWDLTFESAKADWSGKVRVKGIILNGSDGRTLFEAPELILELDMDLLLQSQKVLVKRARITDPLIRLRCADAANWKDLTTWNCNLPSPRPSETAPPDLIVENAAVLVQMASADGAATSEFRAAGIRVAAVPDSRHGYTTDIEGQVQHVGRIELRAGADFAHGSLAVKGRCDKIDLNGIVQTILGVSPAARDQVATLSALNERARRNRAVRLASAGEAEPVLEPAISTGNTLEDLGLHADLSVEFNASRRKKGEPLAYSLIAEVRDGQVTNPNIPAPLYGLKGHVAINQDGLVVRNLMASNGDRRLNIDGHWEFQGTRPERRFTFQASELSIGPEVRSYLPAPLQVRYDQLEPEGKFKIDVEYNSAFEGVPIKLRELSVVDGSVKHELFPYHVGSIRGGVRQEGSRFELEFYGQANGRPVTLKGVLGAMSADASLTLDINVTQLPIDTQLLRAFSDSKQPALVKLYPVLESLKASGVADWDIHLHKPEGAGRKFVLSSLTGKVSRGTLNYERFPYYIRDVTGVIEFDRSVADTWMFRTLRGVHASDQGVTQVSGEGSFALQPAPGQLELVFTALTLPLDIDLQSASVRALPEMSKAWEELAPSGSADIHEMEIHWSPGRPAQVVLPSIQLKNVRIKPKHLPYAWEHLNCAAKWNGERVIVRSLQAYHDQTYLNIDSGGRDDQDFAYFEIVKGASPGWRLHLQELTVKKLLIDDELRSALPKAVRDIATHANPTNPFDLKLGIDMKGALNSEVVTAHWTTEATLQGGNITLGVPMQNVRGVIGITSGKFDGETVSAVGSAAFEQATILDLPFTDLQSPFQVEGAQVSVGAPAWSSMKPSQVKPRFAGRSLKAAVYGGRVSLDATANIDPLNQERSSYALQLNVEDVQLQAIARANQWRERLFGEIRGFVSLRGVGSDPMKIVTDDRTKNWVQIQPARLLDLPVFVKLFQFLSFNPGENFMFNSASGEFSIKNAQFNFSSIALDGTSISLAGSGTVGYITQALDLQFITQARSRVAILKPIVEALGGGWMAISVRGTTDNPVVTQSTQVPIVTPAIQKLRETVERGQAGRPMGRTAVR
ncbi:hypothetical protein Pan44_01780 [Caulifigura coniformis]|uniref:Uncharacterized protein n=1 Tax=Caulifigura coniformis TaxID=2527983 RepID=A0A517S7T5_9PLAN|nr:AsmA-like C-terminal region-containing protein [Caulifigura coniformis]QDT52169.1 hypothetical protein Pan44_01780 [Caulifigura coniformis]